MSSPLRMLFIAISAVKQMGRQKQRFKGGGLGAKVKNQWAGAAEHREQRLSCYSGDTPQEGQENGDT